MAFLDQLGEELEEEAEEEHADVHPVDVSIRGNNDLVVAQSVEALLDVEGGLEEVELLVFVDHLLGLAVGVLGLASEREDSLGLDVANLGDGAGGGVALGEEDGALELLLLVALGVAEMDAAVEELAVVEAYFLGLLAGALGNAGHGLALALAVLNGLEDDGGGVRLAVEIVVELRLDEVADELGHRRAVGTHIARAEFGLGLALEHRFLYLHGDGCHHAVADVGILKLGLAEKLLDGAADSLLEGCEVGAALGGVLAVDKRVKLLAILPGVGYHHLDVVALQVDYRIEGLVGHRVLEEVFETAARVVAFAVEDDGEAGVEEGVVLDQGDDELLAVAVVAEDGGVGGEGYERAVGLVGRLHGGLGLNLSA